MQITEALDEYLNQLRANGRSPHTVAQAKRHVLALAQWTEKPLRDVTHQEIARFLITQQDGRSPVTINALRSSISCFFAFAEAAGYVEGGPARLVQRARTCPPPPRGLSGAEQERLVGALHRAESWEERRDRALFLTMLGTGVRLGAALALCVGDIDIEGATIAIRTKGDVRARLPISPAVRDLLAAWLPEAGPVFPSRSGAALSPRQVQARFKSWCRRAGIRSASPHALRHTFAMCMLRRTGDISLVQRALTHRSIASTVMYARADDATLRAALTA